MVSTANTLRNGARRWSLVALLAVLGAVAGYAFARVAPPTYVARAYVAAVARAAGDNPAAVSYANAYAKMASQSDVLNAAVQASGGSSSAAELRTHVRATTSPDAPVIEVTGSARSAQQAADMANQVAAGLVSTAARTSNKTRIDFVVLSAAGTPVDRAAPRPALDVAVGAAVGVLLGGLVLLTGLGRGPTRRGPGHRTRSGPDEQAVGSLATVPLFTDPAPPHPGDTIPQHQDPSGPPRGAGVASDNRGG
jgi:capsular polysaccharide biosynthesis protein